MGKLVTQIPIKCDGDLFHELFRERPHQLSAVTPDHIQNCDLHEGEWGTVGSVVVWNYFHDGKDRVAKEVIEAIDEEKKLVTFKLIDGDLKEQLKSFRATIQVETVSNGKDQDNMVTWTLEYEKQSEDTPDPHSLIDLIKNVTKDIEAHHLKQS